MVTLSQVKRGIRHPNLVVRKLNILYNTWGNRRCYEAGVDVFETDWDNLIILDACRYDVFESRQRLPGELQSRMSRGTSTYEFMRANFDGRDLRDTVYVTANPQFYRYQDVIDVEFHDVVNVWEGEWADEYRTVLPETVTEYALRGAAEYPNKRLVVHYLQPHYPFIGPTGRERFDLDRLDGLWPRLHKGDLDVSMDVLWRAFEENLNVVLPHVEELLHELPGKSVVTADHGNMFGERASPIPIREYGHPGGMYTEELLKIPWLVFTNGERKRIVAEDAVADSDAPDVDERTVEDRLDALGYR